MPTLRRAPHPATNTAAADVTRRRRPARSGRAAEPAAAALLYLAISLCYFGLPVLSRFGRDFIGSGTDPQIFIWALGWWPHAIAAGTNPVVTHVLWSPAGSDLAWTTAVPGLALLLAPVATLAGPVAAYNVAALLLPAAAAFAAFLLCRHLTAAFWPSLAGGYIFGFSSYLLGHELGHLHLTAVFTVPLVALCLLRFVEGSLGGGALTLRLGVLLALQFSFGTEVFFTLTLAIVAGLAAAALAAPARRPRLRALLAPLACSYGLGLLLVSPLLYYALSDFQAGAITPTGGRGADLVTFAFPTGLTALGGGLAQHFDPSIPIVSSEDGEYLGLPSLLIVAAYLWRRRRTSGGRFLALTVAVAALATLGSELRVRGVSLLPLPWRALQNLPLFDNVIPGRLALYLSLLVAVTVALWAATPGRPARLTVLATGLAVLAIVPDLGLSDWHQRPERPQFFATGLVRSCLRAGENTLLLPPPVRNEGLLWQAEDRFRFGIANAGLNGQLPTGLPDRPVAQSLADNKTPAGGARAVLRFARDAGVGAILVDLDGGTRWRSLLSPALPGRALGGVELYSLGPPLAGCGQA